MRRVVEACGRRGVRYLTLFAFSSENWRRPADEVSLLMRLFVQALEREVDKLQDQGVRLHVVGDLSAFEPKLQELIAQAQERTEHNDRLHLTVAANYGGRWDILQATRAMLRADPGLAQDPDRIDEARLAEHLSMAWAPEPDLFIRTGGEQRISNFLVWQLAYAEFYFTEQFWPDFGADELDAAFEWYRTRERRFGRTSAPAAAPSADPQGDVFMLGQRIITAAVLLAVLALTLALANPWWFVALLALGAACAAWEWLRLTVRQPLSGALCVGLAAALLAAMLAMAQAWIQGGVSGLRLEVWVGYWLTPAVVAVWLLGAGTAVARGRADAPAASLGWTLFAIPAVLAAWSVLALMYLSRGGAYVVSLLALVWVADIAAYFAGRAFGKRKLAPRVSPGKTVAGAVAGVLGAVAWIALSSQWDGTYGQALVERWSWWLALPAAALLGVVSIVGDLFESLLKRRAGRKDSSALLPGHGGVYDRIDAILPVAPLALLMSGVLF